MPGANGDQESFLIRTATQLWSIVAPNREVEVVRGRSGDLSRLTLPTGETVKFAYLKPGPSARMTLSMYPADTLSQAKRLYANSSRAKAVLVSARTAGIEPNFHFGFMGLPPHF